MCVCIVVCLFSLQFPLVFGCPSVIGCRLHFPVTSAPPPIHPSLSRIGCRHHTLTANALYNTNHLSVRPHLNPVLCTVQKPLTAFIRVCAICSCSVFSPLFYCLFVCQLSPALGIVLFVVSLLFQTYRGFGTGKLPMGIHPIT